MDLGTMIVTYKGDISDWASKTSQMKAGMSSIGDSAQSSGSGILGGFGKAISGAVGFASQVGQTIIGVKAFASTAIDLGQALLDPAEKAETMQTAFTTLLGSTSAANAELQKLDAFASKTPFQTMDIDQAASQLIGFGVSAQDTIPDLTAIGDALSAVGKGSTANLGSVVDIFGKIQTEGGLTVGTMQQMSRDGINAWSVLEKETGKTKDQLTTMIQQGLFPAKTALDDLTKGIEKNPLYAGGMAKQSNTMVGIISTLKSNWDQMLVSFGSPIIKGLEGGLAGVGQALTSPAFKSFAGGVGQGIANVFSDIGGFISNDVVPAFHTLQPVVQQFVAYFQSDQFAGIVADFQTVGNQINRIAGDFQQAAGPANNLVNGALSSLPGILEGIFQAADDVIFPLGQFLIWMQGADPWTQVIKDGLIGIGVAMASIKVGSLLAMLPELIATYGFWAGAAWGVVVAEFATIAPLLLIGAAIAAVVAIIILAVTHWSQIVDVLKAAWGGVSSFFKGLFSGIGQGFSNLGSFMRDKATDTKNAVGNAFSGLGTMLHDKGTDAKNGFQQGWGNVGNWFQDRGKDIKKTAQDIGAGAVAAGNWMYQHNTYWKAAVDDITAGIVVAKKWIVDTWNDITRGVVVAWKWLSDTASSAWHAVTQPIIDGVTTAKNWITDKWNQITGWVSGQWKHWSTLAHVYFTMISVEIQARIWEAIAYVTNKWNQAHSWLMGKWNQLAGLARVAWQAVSGVFSGIWQNYIAGPLGNLWNRFSGWFGGIASAAFTWGSGIVQGIINGIGSKFSDLGNMVHNGIGGALGGLGFHGIPGFASGVQNFAGGLAVVGENGPELVSLPGGSNVYSHQNSMQGGTYPIRPSATAVASSVAMQQSAGGGNSGNNTYIFEVDGQQLARITQPHVDSLVRLKMGPRGRVA